MIELGGNIELSGFADLDSSELIILKKIIGNYARKFADNLQDNYKVLSLNLKQVGGEKSSKYEVHGHLDVTKGKGLNAECTKNNIFVCIDEVLKKLEKQLKT